LPTLAAVAVTLTVGSGHTSLAQEPPQLNRTLPDAAGDRINGGCLPLRTVGIAESANLYNQYLLQRCGQAANDSPHALHPIHDLAKAKPTSLSEKGMRLTPQKPARWTAIKGYKLILFGFFVCF